MDQATKDAVLSAVRSLLIVLGSGLVAKGYLSDGVMQQVIGAVMVLLPAAWGIWDKYEAATAAKARDVVAVNAGIALADSTIGATPKVTAFDAPAIIAIHGDTK